MQSLKITERTANVNSLHQGRFDLETDTGTFPDQCSLSWNWPLGGAI